VSVDGWEVEHCAVATRAAYQLENVALAVAACRLLLGTLHGDAVRAAVAGTVVPGRLQVIAERPLTLADGAHNPDGVRALVASLDPLHLSEPRVLVLSVLADKDVATMVELLASRFATVVCTQSSEPRALSASALAAAVHRSAPAAEVCCESEPATALAAGRRLAGSSGTVLVSGSLYLLADLSGELSGRSPTVY
jgi:dihydrofolate synthase/folylpolyglutamate synthase